MTKQYMKDYWSEEQPNGAVNIGFMRMFIDDVLGECFQIVPSNMIMVVAGKPMLTIETNCGIKTVRSPVTGTLQFFSTTARDYPDRITEEDVILTILPKGVKIPQQAAKKVQSKTTVNVIPDIWFGDAFNQQPNNNTNNEG